MHKQSWVAWAVGILAAGLAALAIAQNFVRAYDWDPEVVHSSQAKQSLHTISLALERYAFDNAGNYPATLQPLRDQAYLPHLPDNPYDRKTSRGPMPQVPLGQHAAGGVTYVPAYGLSAGTPAHCCTGYTLLV